MFGAGPDEPPWPVVVACDGWFVVCMIGAGADGPAASQSGTLDSRWCRNSLNESIFFSEFSPYFIGKSIDWSWKFQKRFQRAKRSAVGC